MKSRVIIPCMIFTLTGCAAPIGPAPAPAPVNETQTFGGDYITIHPPASSGWKKYDESQSGIIFAKGDRAANESTIAAVIVSALPPTDSPAAMEDVVKAAIHKDNNLDPGRLDKIEESVAYSDERPYPCVRYHLVAKDTSIKPNGMPLILELYSLYCRHPVQPKSGFSVLFSHRGQDHYSGLKAEAESYFAGIRVKGQ